MQYIPEPLRKVLNDNLKAGQQSAPKCVVEVDRMTYIPGHVEEVTFYDQDFVTTVASSLGANEEVIDAVNQTNVKAVFPFQGMTWADLGKKFAKTSDFGSRGGAHKGTDLSSYASYRPRKVVAMWAGQVVAQGKHSSMGNYVTIAHGNGVLTRYMHFADNTTKVKKGDIVKAGQEIGTEGNTGNVRGATGIHLHVEVHTNASNGAASGTTINPLPYLKGEKTINVSVPGGKSTTTVKNTVTQEIKEIQMVEKVTPGEYVLNERFSSTKWHHKDNYEIVRPDDGRVENVNLKNGYYRPTWTFTGDGKDTGGLRIEVELDKEGYFAMSYSSDLYQGSYIEIYVDDGDSHYTKINSSQFKGIGIEQSTSNIKLKPGKHLIEIVLKPTGKNMRFALHSLVVKTSDVRTQVPEEVTRYEEVELPASETEKYEFIEKEHKINLQVGTFAYQDTLTLDNVSVCEVNRNLDQESAEARLTLSNPDGFYSPDYNPYYFPDLHAKNKQSPFSYKLPGGFHVGVLAENTPIRIYMGYGLLGKPMRVFTGLIDSVTTNSAEGTLDITARDMYKKLINATIMERKVYGKASEPIYESTSSSVPTVASSNKNVSVSSMSRRNQIYYWAFEKCKEWKLPQDAAYFLLAICWHETVFGTAGQGTEPRNMILGYGSYDSNPDYSYGGIEKQMHYGAKRVAEALKSRGYVPKSLDDIRYFWKGGDKGKYQWATDTQWPEKVWKHYKTITANKASYVPPNLPSSESQHASANKKIVGQTEGEQWLKTAIIQDLLDDAGMYGWRAAVDDMKYPDSFIEESYVISVNPLNNTVVRALPEDKVTGEQRFETVKADAIQTVGGYLNPFVEPGGKTFEPFEHRVAEAIQEIIKDTNYRSYCDRYGTYRLELLNYETPVVAEFKDSTNLISLNKTIDHTRTRSHIVVYHDKKNNDTDKNLSFGSFIDKELQLELKGEIRSMSVLVPWASTPAMKEEVAKKLFFQMKQMSRTLQASIPGNPALDLLDSIRIHDKGSATSATYFIKGIRDSFDINAGYIQIIDLTWAAVDQIVQARDFIVNVAPPQIEDSKDSSSSTTTNNATCEKYGGTPLKYGMKNNATVKKVQQFLISKGFNMSAGADGHFGSQTQTAVKNYQKSKGLTVDGIVGPATWNSMFCPNGNTTTTTTATGNSYTVPIKGSRSWRGDKRIWRTDNDYLYQGQWESYGHHKGFIFLDFESAKKQLKGKKIKKVQLYLERYKRQGVHATQYPTFWLHNQTSASGTPSMIANTSWKSTTGWAINEKKWVTLPNYFGEYIRDGKAKGIGTYVSTNEPYIYFYGSNNMKLVIETE